MTKIGKVCLTLGLMAASIIFVSNLYTRSVGATDISWSTTPPKFISFTPDQVMPSCLGTAFSGEVDGVGKHLPLCLTDQNLASGFRWGYYLSYTTPQAVISFNNESKFYPVVGFSYTPRDVRYTAANDSLIMRSQNNGGRLVIYDNVMKRLAHRTNLLQTYFEFDTSKPDYVSSLGTIGAIGASSDGRYVVFEIRDNGLAFLDRKTMTTRRISGQIHHYGWGSDPMMELAVSSDGRVVAQAGQNVALSVFAVDDNCGIPMEPTSVAPLPVADCRLVSLPYADFLTTTSAFYAPSFSAGGSVLKFYLRGFDGRSGYVSLGQSDRGNSLGYLALGDSYTSGEGELDDAFYAVNTNSESEKCHLSTRSYPFLYGIKIGLAADDIHNVACSGAHTDDVVGRDDNYWGQSKRLGSGGLNLGDTNRLKYQTEALADFIPGRVHQLSFVEKYQPQLITLGIGGNDSGLFGKLAACAMPGECEWTSDKGRAQTYDEINNLEGKLTHTYQTVKQASPGSKFYVINYPEVINASGKCDLLTAAMFTSSERQLITQSIIHINDVIDRAANNAGIPVLSIEDAFVGHRLCDNDKQPAVNSLQLGDDFGPSSYQFLHRLGNETFHPTPYGQQLIADKLFQQLDKPGGVNSGECDTCRQQPSFGYWPSGETLANYPSSRYVNFTRSDSVSNLDSPLQLILAKYSLAPLSDATVTIDDETITTTQADDSGGLSLNFSLPAKLSEGVHTLHLLGSSMSGAAIDDYDMISYSLAPTVEGSSQNPDISNASNQGANSQNQPASKDEVLVSVNNRLVPSSGKRLDGNLTWNWQLPAGDSSQERRLDASVLGWRSPRQDKLLAWLFGAFMPPNRFWLTLRSQTGIISAWLIFGLW